MKTGRTLSELAQEIARQSEQKLDLIAGTPTVVMTASQPTNPQLGMMVRGSKELHQFSSLTKHAHNQLAAGLEIPRHYYNRLHEKYPHLLADNVNTLLRGEPASTRMIRTLDGRVRAWLGQRYRPIDNEYIVEFLGPIFDEYSGRGLVVRSCEITERRIYIKVAYPAVQAEVRVGQVVQSGFVIENSEVGDGYISAYPWLEVLACTNGMKIVKAGQRRMHAGTSQQVDAGEVIEYSEDTQRVSIAAIMFKMRDIVRACLDREKFERIVEVLREASAPETEMKDPALSVEVLAKRISLTEGERSSVLAHLIKGGDITAWGAANAVTRTAEDAQSYDRATELEQAGYEVVQMVGTGEWAKIAALVPRAA